MSQFSNQNPTPKRPRGAQPGNLNALKHGRYLTSDHLPEFMPLDPAHFSDLGKYIAMIKKFMQFTYDEGMNSTHPQEVRDTLHLLSLAGLSISRLANLQRRIKRQSAQEAASK